MLILDNTVVSNKENFDNFITEAVKHSLPDTLKDHISKKSNREEMLEKFGERAFLIPKELKFPVINPFTEDYDCRLIYAAYVRAKQHDYKDVAKKAKELYEANDCQSEIEIEIEEGNIIKCHELFDFFDFENHKEEKMKSTHSLFEEKEKDSEYQKFFDQKLKEWEIESPQDLDEEKRKKFFDEVSKEWDKKKN